MFHPERLLGHLLKSGLSGGLGRSRRRKPGGSLLGALSGGAKAQLGMGLIGVAIAAYEHYSKQNQVSVGTSPAPNPGSAGAVVPVTPMPRSSLASSVDTSTGSTPATDATLMVQAMVAAAAADGVIDETERAQMLRRADEAGFDEVTRKFLEEELAHPASLAVIVGKTRKELATDVYAASCAAINPDTDAERVYLESLARNLGLTSDATAEIHRQLGVS